MQRERNKKKQNAQSALERLKKQRMEGTTAIRNYEVNEEESKIYDEVDERDYEILVKRKLKEEDFVVDDDGHGYVDYGLDDGSDVYDSEEEELEKERLKQTKSQGQNIGKMFQKQHLANANKRKDANVVGWQNAPKQKNFIANDTEDIDSMLKEVDEEAHRITTEFKSNKRKASTATDILYGSNKLSTFHGRKFEREISGSNVVEDIGFEKSSFENNLITEENDEFMKDVDMEFKEPPVEDRSVEPVITEQEAPKSPEPVFVPKVKVLQTKKDMFTKKSSVTVRPLIQPNQPQQVDVKNVVKSSSNIVPMEKGVGGWWSSGINDSADVNSAVDITANVSASISNTNMKIMETGESLFLYWLDAYEMDSTIYLFGKVFNQVSESFVSCVVVVTGIERTIHVLPRSRVLADDGTETDQDVNIELLWQDLDAVLSSQRISNWAFKETRKKYAFEVPNVPVEADWIEINYGFNLPNWVNGLSGKTYSHVFGTNTTALELFLLKLNLMGPCWLEIKEASLTNRNVSWCKVEASVKFKTSDVSRQSNDDFLNIRVLSDSDLLDNINGKIPAWCKDTPTLKVMSISMKTVMNYKTNVTEIVALSMLVYNQVQIEGATSDTDLKDVTHFGVVRQLNDTLFPMNFENNVKSNNLKIEVMKNESGLLNFFSAFLHRMDPDVLIGHNFVAYDLDVLLHRMKDLNTSHWSRIGRLRRSKFPKLQAGGGGQANESTYAERQVFSGRLVCDTYLAARDLVKSKSYSLANLSAELLSSTRPALDNEKIPNYFSDSNSLIYLVQHCQNDAYLSARLAFHLMVLPLTKQLTCLAGNLWSRTLCGGRSERNEFLLLHEFWKSGFIVPDKVIFGTIKKEPIKKKNVKVNTKKSEPAPEVNTNSVPVIEHELGPVDDDEDGDVKKVTGRRKPAYAGGLVLEPKKGLYDKYVLMLDFNSLYPSIIQEYNICFTTLEDGEEEEIPNLPDPQLEQGILPRLIATLVQRRRQVKGLMKKADISPSEYAQLNIRQQALKLTANSMYGCLGFTHSRFYAKPLAMLITSKGRDILQDTVTLAENTLNLEVIYGDTDSIMVYTGTEDLAEVKSLGLKLKTAVNKKYKLLEIEMDGFFRRMLLLKKKKYAALTVTEGKNNQLKISRETKGLDLVRRDWCELSHDVSNFVLDQILSDKDREETMNNIHEYLQKIGQEIKDGNCPIEKFVINKGLTKAPEEYADAKVQPHVQVALKMKARGIPCRSGDTVPYIICLDADNSKSFALRAYHPDDLAKSELNLKVDIDYYLNNQVFPPISRLCQPIEETNISRLAECLGLDASKYRGVGNSESYDGSDITTFESQISDEERFRDCDRFVVTCTHCKEKSIIEGIVRKEGSEIISGLSCKSCNRMFVVSSLEAQLLLQIRKFVSRYYSGLLLCDEPSCQHQTHQISVAGYRCTVKHCSGVLRPEYSDRALYSQLLYFSSLFDYERYLKKNAKLDDKGLISSIAHTYSTDYNRLNDAVMKYLSNNARGFVDLRKLFYFMHRFKNNGTIQSSR